jgi:exopolyphosphatase/guanosine-5'-triphosphate,3'-diphosphate pyrophosphatase
VATAACRRAENCDEFLHRVNKEAGLFLETISAEEEAGLAVAACQPLLEAEARFALVFDIGGGSTELIWAHHDVETGVTPIAVTSLPNGVVSIAERHGSGDFSLEQYETLAGEIAHQLRAFEDAHGINDQIRQGGVQMIGTSGTVTTLSGVHLGLTRYDRQRVDGMWLSFTDASAAAEQLRAMTLQQRAAHPCIGRGRADLVVAGCAILEAIRRTWPTERLRVADRGVREGLLLSLMRGDQQRTPNTGTRGGDKPGDDKLGNGAQSTTGIGAAP